MGHGHNACYPAAVTVLRYVWDKTFSGHDLLEQGKEEELKVYPKELNETMDRPEFRFKTGNTVVDTLLNMKYHEITHAVPDLRLDVEGLPFPEKLFIRSYDIGIIIGNALDNAIEACRKLKVKEPDAEDMKRREF